MKKNHVLVDYENVPVPDVDKLSDPLFRLTIFLGPANTKLPRDLVLSVQAMGERAEYLTIVAPGKNALDFQMAYHLGVLSTTEPETFFHIISRDSGFDPLIRHLKTRGIFAARSESIDAIPYFAASKPAQAVATLPIAESQDLLSMSINNLASRKTGKPRTEKTLASTIHAVVGKHVDEKKINEIITSLKSKKLISIDGTKVVYHFPEAS